MAFLLGSIGVLVFSFSLPATRLAVEDLDPVVVGVGRAVVAAALAAMLLALLRQPRPRRDQLPGLALVGLGVVVGFPLLTALELERLTSSHGAVVIALLPAATGRGRSRAPANVPVAASGSHRPARSSLCSSSPPPAAPACPPAPTGCCSVPS